MKVLKPKNKKLTEQVVALILEKESWNKLKLIKKHLKLPYKDITKAALEQYLEETWESYSLMIDEAKKKKEENN